MLRLLLVLLAAHALACGDDGGTPGADRDAAPSPRDARIPVVDAQILPRDAEASSDDAAPPPATDGATPPAEDTGPAPAEDAGAPPSGSAVLVVVGYGGGRARSTDNGRTWGDYTQLSTGGGDNPNLLRAVTFAEGQFIAVGARLFTSPDGAAWTEHTNPGGWMGGVARGNDVYLACGGNGECIRSDDGRSWSMAENATGFTDHVRSLIFHDGFFYVATDNNAGGPYQLFRSANGSGWELIDPDFGSHWLAVIDGTVVSRPVDQPAEIDGVLYRNEPGPPYGVQRNEGDGWVDVFIFPDGNSPFQATRFAFARGFVD